MSDAVVPHQAEPSAPPARPAAGWFGRALESDMFYSFRRSKLTMVAAAVTLLFFLLAIFASVLAVQNPFDPAQLQLMNSRISPLWTADGQSPFLLGTDEQGRDVFSAILYGLRISLTVGVLGVMFAGTLGIMLGLIAGYVGGAVDGLIMRIADVQLTFPAILIALLINGVAKSVFGNRLDAMSTLAVLVFAIGLSFWVQYARTVRGSVMVEKNKDYVAAAQLIGLPAPVIMLRHVLPNTMGPILVIATINLALAIITEATLSFLGAGMPDTMPSLGTLIRIGNNYLFAGEWWIVAFPGFALAGLILSINLLGDWLRDALNPKAPMTDPVLSVRNLQVEFAHPPQHAARDRRNLVRHRQGRSARRGRRIRRRQIGHRPRGDRPDRSARPHCRRRDLSVGHADRPSAAGRDPPHPGQTDRHDLPGSADQPQSALPDRRPDRRDHQDPHSICRRARRASAPSICWPKSAFPRRKSASTPIRTNSPAACASAS